MPDDDLKTMSDNAIRKLVLEPFHTSVRKALSLRELRMFPRYGPRVDAYLGEHVNGMVDDLIMFLDVSLPAEHVIEKRQVTYPSTWWDAFKARWFPKTMLRWWPVIETTEELQVDVWAVLPRMSYQLLPDDVRGPAYIHLFVTGSGAAYAS